MPLLTPAVTAAVTAAATATATATGTATAAATVTAAPRDSAWILYGLLCFAIPSLRLGGSLSLCIGVCVCRVVALPASIWATGSASSSSLWAVGWLLRLCLCACSCSQLAALAALVAFGAPRTYAMIFSFGFPSLRTGGCETKFP